MGNRAVASNLIEQAHQTLFRAGVLCPAKRNHIIKTLRANFSLQQLIYELDKVPSDKWVYYYRLYDEYGGNFKVYDFEPKNKKNVFQIKR